MNGKTPIFFLILFGLLTLVALQTSVNAATTDEQTTTSNVTVNVYVSISLSSALSSGVEFGSLDPGTDDTNSTNCDNLGCNISVSSDSNIAVDIVMKATDLTRFGGAQTIPSVNYTWASTDGSTLPFPTIELNTTEYDYRISFKVGDSVAASGKRSWQAAIDVPSSQTAGLYNNTLYFCANQEDTSDCGA